MSNADVWTARRPPAGGSPGTGRTTSATSLHRTSAAIESARHAPDRSLTRRLFGTAALVVGLSLTVAFTAMALLPTFGMRTMIVLSGSMAPMFHAGDAIVVGQVDPDDVRVGDVIAFTGYGTDHLTTHRVIGLRDVNDELHFRTQGDANPDPDANLAPAGGLHGSVRVVLPYAGKILAPLTGRHGKLILLGIPGSMLVVTQVRALLASAKDTSGGTNRTVVALTAVTILAAATITGAAVLHTLATFTDVHAATDNTFRTGAFGSN